MSASKSSSCRLSIGFSESMNAISTPARGAERREIEIGIGRRAVRLPEIAGERDAELIGHGGVLSLLRLAAVAELRDRLGERVVQHPDIAGIADEIEALRVEVDALLDRRHQAAERLVVLLGGRDRSSRSRRLNFGWSNSPGMPSDTDRSKWPTQRQSTPSIAAMASAFSTPSAVSIWQKKRRALVGGGELVGDRTRPVAVMRHLQRHAAPARADGTSSN